MNRNPSLVEEADAFLAAHPGIRHLDAFIIDICGNAVGKRYPAAEIRNLYTKGSTLCASTQLLDVQGNSWDTAGLGFSDGDPDAPSMPIPGTLAPVPWAPEPRAQCLLTLDEPGGTAPLWYDPRVILGSVAGRFAELGLSPVVAVELEFYLIDRERAGDGAPQPPASPRTGTRDWAGKVFGMEVLEEFGEVIGAIEAACLAQGLPVTTIISEYGPGQFEVNLAHLPDPVRAADHAALLRRAVREVARSRDMDATFMAKPYGELSGSGLQVNLSLLDGEGNIFDPRRGDGEARLGQAIAGMQAALAESMAIFAPDLNAYRRFEANQFTPVTTDWGANNRSVAFRVPDSAPENRRIEHRAGGAEANPYLVMAAVLAAAHHGLANRLTPTAPGSGNVGEEADPALPLRLWSALEHLERAAILPGYLSRRYLDAYVHVKRAELDAFMAAILPREYAWYL
ncbi:MAG: glutamine synthetase family protein [Paracoccaceae bacterium]